MTAVAQVAAALAGLLHVVIFWIESLAFRRPEIHRRFQVRTDAALEAVRPWAFNQGFYNLFLAIGALIGVVLWITDRDAVGEALVTLSCGSMVAAAVVLLATDRRMARAAATQGVIPLVALAALVVS